MYSLLLPDDRTQIVSYYADENGYFPTISYKGGHQFNYYFTYPHEASNHPEHLQKGTDVYKNPRRPGQGKQPHHPTTAGDHYTSRVGRLGEVALSKPLIQPLRLSAHQSQKFPGHSYTSLPVSKYQAPLTAKSQSPQHSSALLKSLDPTRHSYRGDEVKSHFSLKRLPLVAEQKYISPGNSYQHSSDSSGYSYDHPSMKNAPSYAQNTYVTAQPHVLPSQSYGPPPPPKYSADSKVPVLGAAKPTAHELRKPTAHALSDHYGPPHHVLPSQSYGPPPPPKYNADSRVPVLGAAKPTAYKPTAHALSDHYGPPHQTGYSSKTLSPKPLHHASTPAVKGLPSVAAHPAKASALNLLNRGLLVASRMLEDGEDLSVYIASLDSPDSGYSDNPFTMDDFMALINFDVTKTLFRPPNILTDQPFFRPPRTLRRLITTEDLVS
ncbi:tyrosine-protein phosphatase non-receptor type 23-like [Macrobrachium rosenbergii]|uniref:tyrosine-protein phosphatase non-receptor type 23-like n=1 Tax=Macrobrachium rosenbergii TaxID=79674 RepID=UPI0034D6F3B3